jgi:nucleotide-binding universal stress UspA family protein
LSKIFFGSTTDHVLRDSGTAVLAVPLSSGQHANPLERGTSILVGVHVDHRSRKHVETAVGLGLDFRAPVVLVHAVAPIQAAGRWRRHADYVQQPRREGAERALDVICAETRRDVALEAVVEYGDAASVLAKVAADRDARLIVIWLGSPRNDGHRPGSTAYRVVCGADVPVLAVSEAG